MSQDKKEIKKVVTVLDAMIYLWDFMTGISLDSHKLSQNGIGSLIPRCIACSKEGTNVFVAHEGSSSFDHFKIENNKLEKLSSISFTNNPLDLLVYKEEFWVLRNCKTKPFMVFKTMEDFIKHGYTEIDAISKLDILQDFEYSCWSLNGLRKCGKRDGLESIVKKDINDGSHIKKLKMEEEKT